MVALKFEDGAFIGSSLGAVVSLPVDKRDLPEEITCEMLYTSAGSEQDPGILLSVPGVRCISKDDFWSKATGSSGGDGPREMGEYTILGWTASDIARDGTVADWAGGTFSKNLKEKKYVGALAVRSFSSKDAWDAFKFDEAEIERINKLTSELPF